MDAPQPPPQGRTTNALYQPGFNQRPRPLLTTTSHGRLQSGLQQVCSHNHQDPLLWPNGHTGQPLRSKDLANDKRAMVSADYSLESSENHLAAAMALLVKQCRGESYKLLGKTCTNDGYVFVFQYVD